MKRIFLSSAVLIGLTGASLAADLSRGTYVASAPYVAVPVFTWTGLYVGANAGYGFLEDQHESGCGNGFSSFGSCFGGLTVQTTNGLAPVVPITGFINNFGERSSGGFVGGGQIGYNYQVTPGAGFVVGIEADIQAADLGGRERDEFFNLAGFGGVGGFGGFGTSSIFTAAPVTPIGLGSGIASPSVGALGNVALFNNATNSFGQFDRGRIDWFGTVRGRLGYAFSRVLVYATGGVAFTDREHINPAGFGGLANGAAVLTVDPNFPASRQTAALIAALSPTNNFGPFRRDENNVGYVVGGGLEYAFTNNLTTKIEGLYVNFDRTHRTSALGPDSVVGVSNTGALVLGNQVGLGFDSGRNHDDFVVVRAGLNWKFGLF